MWDLIVLVSDRCLSFYFSRIAIELLLQETDSANFADCFWFDRDRTSLLTTENAPLGNSASFYGKAQQTRRFQHIRIGISIEICICQA